MTTPAEAVAALANATLGRDVLPQSAHQEHLRLNLRSSSTMGDNQVPGSLEMFNNTFDTVINPVAIATGIVGNALLALVFLITPLRLRPLSHVLAGLGVADFVYTLSSMLTYLSAKGVQVYDVPGACHIVTFTLALSKSLEGWYILACHINRLTHNTKPGSEGRKALVFNTKFAIFFISILVSAPLLHVLWSMETLRVASSSYCVPIRGTMIVHLTVKKIEVFATVLLPLTLIVGADLLLAIKLLMHVVFKTNVQTDGSSENSNNYCSSSSQSGARTVVPPSKKDCCKNKESDRSDNAFHSIKFSEYSLQSDMMKKCNLNELSSALEKNKELVNVLKGGVEPNVHINIDDLKQFKKDLNSTSEISPIEDACVLNTAEKCIAIHHVLKNLKNSSYCDLFVSEIHKQSSNEEHDKFTTTACSSKRCSISTSSLCSTFSYAPNTIHSSRSQATLEDNAFPNDAMACTMTTVLLGVGFAVAVLPSTYIHAIRLFLESPSTRPSPHAMQQAIFFENFIKLHAVYKLFLYIVLMPSFRQAIMWLLTSWLPSKIARMPSLCSWNPATEKNDITPV